MKLLSSCLVVSLFATSAMAGNNHSTGMHHDQHRVDQQRQFQHLEQMQRDQQEGLRRAAHERAVYEHQARLQRESIENARIAQEERDRIERERLAAIAEQKRINAELETQNRAAESRREELERQRAGGNLNPTAISLAEMVDVFRHTADPAIKEAWACMILILDREHNESIAFLRDIRGWSIEEIAGLNPV